MSQAASNLGAQAAYERYALIEKALQYIERRAADQPSLAEIAAEVGLSPAHFQRVFSEWVGVSPKKYLSYLTLDHAKRLLADRHTVLDATYAAGLSSPSRLHDLFVTWEAMTPGVYAAGGEGLTIKWGLAETPFGEGLAMVTDTAEGLALCGLGFTGEVGMEAAYQDLAGRWKKADYVRDDMAVRAPVAAACGGGEPSAPAKLSLIGAPFQIKVWEALLRIPTGSVTTYSDIATAIGSPKAVRAVGTAVGRNPISWLVPCHRALRKSGALGGYHWGLDRKRAMLAYEGAWADAQAGRSSAA